LKSELTQIMLTDASQLIHRAGPLALLFMVDWCGECRIAESILCDIQEEFIGQLAIYKINMENEKEAKTESGIGQFPTLLVTGNHDFSEMVVGIKPKFLIKETIKRAINQVE
jgi:thioredoxin